MSHTCVEREEPLALSHESVSAGVVSDVSELLFPFFWVDEEKQSV